jgi:flagellar hook protein FlgE
MASTTAMYTGLSGLTANSRHIDVIGNNIANVNTTAYKSNRMLFSTAFTRNIRLGSGPADTNGGTNPTQIGLGVAIAGTQRNFSTGSIATTGDQGDLAIEGDGFFVVRRGVDQFYTRAGAFRRNSLNDLVTISGDRVMGYGVDDDFNVTANLEPLNIPIGQLSLVEATENAHFIGQLNSDGDLATQGSVSIISPIQPVAGALTTASLLTDIDDPNVAGAQALFAIGETIELTGVLKGGQGGRTLPDAQLAITATTTIQDYLDFLTDALGIDTAAAAHVTGTPGATFNPGTGEITVVGNLGTENSITISPGNIRHLDSASVAQTTPFTTTNPESADGESVTTRLVVYDSLGNPVDVFVTATLVNRPVGAGTRWDYIVESPDDSDVDLLVGTGQLSYDENGILDTSAGPASVTIDRDLAGSVDPFTFNLDFGGTSSVGLTTDSTLRSDSQDGTPPGLLSGFSVGDNGIITGIFTNGATRAIGQVVLAKFSNPEGLVDAGGSVFAVGPNSGTPILVAPTELGAGRIIGGALEQSNVDLAEEFIKLIQASTGYSAASRIITTTDQLFQQLLVLGR